MDLCVLISAGMGIFVPTMLLYLLWISNFVNNGYGMFLLIMCFFRSVFDVLCGYIENVENDIENYSNFRL